MDDIDYARQLNDVDARFRARLSNQIDTINRLLNGSTYDTEMDALHDALASAQAERDALRERVKALERT